MRVMPTDYNSWELEIGGTRKLTIDPSCLASIEVKNFLLKIQDQSELYPSQTMSFEFAGELTEQHCSELAEYIHEHANNTPFEKLSFHATANIVKTNEFRALIEALNNSKLQHLHLTISDNDKVDIATSLLEKFDNSIHFFLTLSESSKQYEALTTQIINNIHGYTSLTQSQPCEIQQGTSTPSLNTSPEFSQPLKLKDLLHNDRNDFEGFIQHEVQHVEIEQQEQTETVEEVIEETVEEQNVETYDGNLVDFKKFRTDPSYTQFVDTQAYSMVANELFANLPHAIKFLTPDAALVLAKNIRAFSAISKENLPANFLLKKTYRGEWVLDYDRFAEEKKTTPFTPQVIPSCAAKDPLYPICIPEDAITIVKTAFDNPPPQIHRLWQRHAKQGVSLFVNNLNECEKIQPGIKDFLYEHYLQHFPQWDHFLDNDDFATALNKISAYDEATLNCLQKFLVDTGYSQHNLANTLQTFEIFWQQWAQLCAQYNLDTAEINRDWHTGTGGNPIVYMERLLTILRNARNLEEQVQCLDGINLNALGETYASKYEGLKVVASVMGLSARGLKGNDEQQTYAVDLARLTSDEYFTKDEGVKLCARFIAQQEESISIPEYCEHLARIDKDEIEGTPGYIDEYTVAKTLICDLFFFAHEGYLKDVATDVFSKEQAHELLFLTSMSLEDGTVNRSMKKNLLMLFNRDTRLSPTEGLAIFQRIRRMNSCEFEHGHSKKLSKRNYINKLFEHMLENKYATLRMIRELAKYPYSYWPFVFALDTAEYLAQDPVVAITYQDDLHLFSHFINSNVAEAYCTDITDKKKEARIAGMLKQVKSYLHTAATQEKPNNLDSAFKMLLNMKDTYDFTFSRCIKIFAEISELPEVDFLATQRIITKHNIKISLELPEIFSRTNGQVKNCLISLILLIQQTDPQESARTAPEPKMVMSHHIETIKENIEYWSNKLTQYDRDHPKEEKAPTEIENYRVQLSEEREKLSERIAQHAVYQAWEQERDYQRDQFQKLSTSKLQQVLQKEIHQKGPLNTLTPELLQPILNKMKEALINEEFQQLEHCAFADFIVNHIHQLKDFASADTFDKIEHVTRNAATLARHFVLVMKHDEYDQNAFVQLFKTIDFSKFEHETLFVLLDCILKLFAKDHLNRNHPGRSYMEILSVLFQASSLIDNTDEWQSALDLIETLDNANFPSNYIEKILQLAKTKTLEYAYKISYKLIPVFVRDSNDSILSWSMSANIKDLTLMAKIAELTESAKDNRDAIKNLLFTLQQTRLKPFDELVEQLTDNENAGQILQLIALSYANTPTDEQTEEEFNICHLAQLFQTLNADDFASLSSFYQHTKPSINVIYHNLNQHLAQDTQAESFTELLIKLEKSPFGKRDLEKQFDVSQVERVINSLQNLNQDKKYTYTYRKQVMEAFYFINQAGYDLPIYNKKPAGDLSNHEIQALFLALKSKDSQFKHLSHFQRQLYALGLMREAMYRTTNQYPYSTQMIALIDCMMHEGSVISNIDTGQGKSLVDAMKAALLWLDSTRVDISTSSTVDAKRDLEIYSPFLSLLAIPHANQVISSTSDFDSYKADGINFSTLAQFALFYSKAKGEGLEIGSAADRVSLVMNESDYSILDNNIIYRYATTRGVSVGVGNEWVYYAVNKFVQHEDFKGVTNSAASDILKLKYHLMQAAKKSGKSANFVKKFADKQLLTWLESAILVNYRLREKYDYIIPPEPETRTINGQLHQTHVIKILMKDGKVSQDTQYGNGMQQLLYAKLNQEHPDKQFHIEPESKKLISMNNRNMIDFYGLIWGSSGTVGNQTEVATQYMKYGFEFSGIEPHQAKIVKHKSTIFTADETKHFSALLKQIKKDHGKKNKASALVFLKDIETAERFYDYLQDQLGSDSSQLYAGLGNEAEVIEQAAHNGMVTITTSALGRNTDVPYDKKIGMNVYQGFIDTERRYNQRSGRTGRQGSAGTIHMILNTLDYQFDSIPEIMRRIETNEEQIREFNEELYNVLGYFLRRVDNKSAHFFQHYWPEFSDEIENRYHDLKLNNAYESGGFLEFVLEAFNLLTNEALKFDDVAAELSHTYSAPECSTTESNTPYLKPVTFADCTPPELIAYHLVNLQPQQQASEISKKDIKRMLGNVFEHAETKQFKTSNRDYINFLNLSSNVGVEIVRQSHEEFFNEFLTGATERSTNRNFFGKWSISRSQLSKVTSNHNYLMLFKALRDIPEAAVSATAMTISIKLSIETLLTEYVETSWFVSTSRKERVNNLKSEVDKTSSLDEIVGLLQTSILDLCAADISVNQESCWRKLKPLHLSGHSRLQSKLDELLRLTTSIVKIEGNITFPAELTKQLNTTLADNTQSEVHDTWDKFKVAQSSFYYRNRANAQVIESSLAEALSVSGSV